MLQTAPRRGGHALVLGMLVLCLLTGSVLAQPATPAPAAEEPTDGFLPTTADVRIDESLVELAAPSPLVNRSLTPAEGQRLYRLYYQYIAQERRPAQEVQVGDAADAFTLSAPLSEYAEAVSREAPWIVPETADFYPWLRFPDREMADEELLALIELQEAFNVLAAWEDPYAGDLQSNRKMTWREQYRYAQLEAAYAQDEAARPKNALPDTPGEGLYLLGHNGGGERVYHYPEDRELTDEELLQMIHIREIQRGKGDSERQTRMELLESGAVVGVELHLTEAEALVLAKWALAEVYGVEAEALAWGPAYLTDTDIPSWMYEAWVEAPAFAPTTYYSVSIADATGVPLGLSQYTYWNGYFLEDQVMFPLLWAAAPQYQAKDPEGPLWREKLTDALALLDLPADPAEVEVIGNGAYPSFEPSFQYRLAFADGSQYFLEMKVFTGGLKGMHHYAGPVVNQ